MNLLHLYSIFNIFIFGCAGSLLLCAGFRLWQAGATLPCSIGASCGGWWFLLFQSTGSKALRLQYLWHTDLADPKHVESSQTRDQTCVPSIGRWIHIQGSPGWGSPTPPGKSLHLYFCPVCVLSHFSCV